MHLQNRFGMTADDSRWYDNNFHNVGRKLFFGDVGEGEEWGAFGSTNHDKLWLGDGEKNSIIYDENGEFTGVPETLIMAPESKHLIRNDCWYDEIYNGQICRREQDYVNGFFRTFATYDGGSGTIPDGLDEKTDFGIAIQDNKYWDSEGITLYSNTAGGYATNWLTNSQGVHSISLKPDLSRI